MDDPSEYPYSFQLYDMKFNNISYPSIGILPGSRQENIHHKKSDAFDDIAFFFIGKDYIPPPKEKKADKKPQLPPAIKTVLRMHLEGKTLYKAFHIIVENFKLLPQEHNPLKTYVPLLTCNSMEEFLLSENADSEGCIYYKNMAHLVERLCMYIEWNEIRIDSFLVLVSVDFAKFLKEQLSMVISLKMPPTRA